MKISQKATSKCHRMKAHQTLLVFFELLCAMTLWRNFSLLNYLLRHHFLSLANDLYIPMSILIQMYHHNPVHTLSLFYLSLPIPTLNHLTLYIPNHRSTYHYLLYLECNPQNVSHRLWLCIIVNQNDAQKFCQKL